MMRNSNPSMLLLALLAAWVAGCGGSEEANSDSYVGLPGFPPSMPGVGSGAAGETVEVAALVALFPDELLGMTKGEQSDHTSSSGGYRLSIVSAEYEGDGRTMRVSVTDYPAGGSALAATNVWTMTDFNRTSSNGHERTTSIAGFRAFESYQSSGKGRAEIAAFVANRVVFSASGEGLSMEDMHRAVKEFGLKRIERVVDH